MYHIKSKLFKYNTREGYHSFNEDIITEQGIAGHCTGVLNIPDTPTRNSEEQQEPLFTFSEDNVDVPTYNSVKEAIEAKELRMGIIKSRYVSSKKTKYGARKAGQTMPLNNLKDFTAWKRARTRSDNEQN